MTNTIFEIAPIPIFYGRLDKDERITSEEIEIIKSIELHPRDYDADKYLGTEANIFKKYKKLKRLKKVFQKYLDVYTKDILGLQSKYKSVHSWYTKNEYGTSHSLHTHPNAMVALTYYFSDVEAGDTDFAKLCFQINSLNKIFPNFQFDQPLGKHNKFVVGEFSLNVLPHNIIIFPSHISHYTTTYYGHIPRYMIGSNYFINGKIGRAKDITQLEIKTG